jgi:hypothetical protein
LLSAVAALISLKYAAIVSLKDVCCADTLMEFKKISILSNNVPSWRSQFPSLWASQSGAQFHGASVPSRAMKPVVKNPNKPQFR